MTMLNCNRGIIRSSAFVPRGDNPPLKNITADWTLRPMSSSPDGVRVVSVRGMMPAPYPKSLVADWIGAVTGVSLRLRRDNP